MPTKTVKKFANHYRRVALLVSDDATTTAMLELAAEYETLAHKLVGERRTQSTADGTQSYPPRKCK
jgi:hypothetical protein